MKKSLIRVLALVMVFAMLLPTFAACVNPDDNTNTPTPPNSGTTNNPPADIVKIEMSASASQIKKGDSVQVTARVTGAKNTQVTWSVSHLSFYLNKTESMT